METVLVAGGAGFIGSHLCEKLLQDEYKVLCVDNLLTGDKKNIEQFLQNSNFRFIEHDVVKPLVENNQVNSGPVAYIFHLASPASPNKNSPKSYINYPIETLLVNSLGTYHLLELAKQKKSLFLFASTAEIYGDPTVSPQSETYFGNVNPNGVRSVYDESKRFGEAMTMAYVRKDSVDARIVRIFNTYGPRMQKNDGRVISNFITQALSNKQITVYGDGTQTRSFCYIEDMVQGILKAMFTQKTSGQVINLGNPDERNISDIAACIKEATHSSSAIAFADLPEDDPKSRKPDITKAKNILVWEPTVSLEEGLSKTISYFQHI